MSALGFFFILRITPNGFSNQVHSLSPSSFILLHDKSIYLWEFSIRDEQMIPLLINLLLLPLQYYGLCNLNFVLSIP